MSEAAVQLRVAGQTYQVVSSAHESELRRLAKVVEEALEGVTAPGRQPSQQALVLAAITLAHELEVVRAEKEELRQKYKGALTSLLGRVDEVLELSDPGADDGELVDVPIRRGSHTTSETDHR